MTCHIIFVQTAADTWATHTETEGRCFARVDALSDNDGSFCQSVSWSNKGSIFKYFIWMGKEVRQGGPGGMFWLARPPKDRP